VLTTAPELDNVEIVERPERGDCLAYATCGPEPLLTIASYQPSQSSLLGLVIHEAAHLLPKFDEKQITWPKITTDVQGNKWQPRVPAARLPTVFPCDIHHGRIFIRCAIHLFARATFAGFRVAIRNLPVAGWHYGLSHPRLYLNSLRREPRRMLTANFDEIAAQPYPTAFSELFDHDCQIWREQHCLGEGGVR